MHHYCSLLRCCRENESAGVTVTGAVVTILRCPTAGSTGVVSQSLASAPRPSRWLLRTIRHSYTIKFVRRLPKFRGIRFTSFKALAAPVLHAEIAVLLAKDAIEPVPRADMSFPVAQLVEHGASNAKIMGSIPRESKS